MFASHFNNTKLKSVGYGWLSKKYSIKTLRHSLEVFVAEQGARRSIDTASVWKEIFPPSYWPGEGDFDHLVFALRYEGLHLPLLRVLLPQLTSSDVATFVQKSPTGAYARKIWFLYEAFTGTKLDIPDLSQGNYVDLADAKLYYTAPAIRSARHRVNMNLLGTICFSPMVRRTGALAIWEEKKLEQQCREFLGNIPHEIYDRALRFLYTKETKSSYAIEHETPDRKRSERFVQVLREAGKHDYLTKEKLIFLQNGIVDVRFANSTYRSEIQEQNYVGTSLNFEDEQVHFISPKPENIEALMDDFLEASRRILHSGAPPVVVAAAIAYPFVFLHPFSDGNGRIHRFLIHYVLSSLGFAPKGVIFPVSAVMHHRPLLYDATLEAFSSLVMPLIDYELDERGHLTVLNETVDYYRAIDCTAMAEALFGFVEETITQELPAEIHFIESYDQARKEMCEIVDFPNRQADLFVRLCLQNKGYLSKAKRALPEFTMLSEEEIQKLEEAVKDAFKITA